MWLKLIHLFSQWHALDRTEQAKYYEMAREERARHLQMYPGWSARDNYAVHKKRRKRKAKPKEEEVEEEEQQGCGECSHSWATNKSPSHSPFHNLPHRPKCKKVSCTLWAGAIWKVVWTMQVSQSYKYIHRAMLCLCWSWIDYHNHKLYSLLSLSLSLSPDGKRNVCELMKRKRIGLARLMIV